MTTLLDIYEAAFDSACDYAENTIDYIVDYADGALDINLSEEKAQIIVDKINNFRKLDEDTKGILTSNDFYYQVEKPLSEIEV